MTNLPSFVELMATLGIDNHAIVPESARQSPSHSRSSSNSSSASPRLFPISCTSRQAHKAQFIPSFRELDPDRRTSLNRHRVVRYSPYAFGHVSGYSIISFEVCPDVFYLSQMADEKVCLTLQYTVLNPKGHSG